MNGSRFERLAVLERSAARRRERLAGLQQLVTALEVRMQLQPLTSEAVPHPEPEPEPEPQPEREPAPESEPVLGCTQGPRLLDTVVIVSAAPTVDTAPPRRGETCNALLRARLRSTPAMDSPETGILEISETVAVLDTHQLERGPLRVLCEVERNGRALRGWLSATAQSGELLLDAGHKRRPRWKLEVDYCADVTEPSAEAAASLRLSDAAPNTMDFCFPAHQQLGRLAGEWEGRYCFVRTLEDGARLYGFCSRLRRADGRVEVVCFCTRYPWFDWWETLLRHIDGLRRKQDTVLETMRAQATVGTAVEVFSVSSQQWIRGEITEVEAQRGRDASQVPLYTVVYSANGDPGGANRTKRVSLHNAAVVRLAQQGDTALPLRELTLSLLEAAWGCNIRPGAQLLIKLADGPHLQLQRPSDGLAPHTEAMNHDALFSAISVGGVIAIFAAMLLEMRVIFVSSQVPKLSACVHAAVALLLPFEWQNIFVPVLPKIWLDYLTAP